VLPARGLLQGIDTGILAARYMSVGWLLEAFALQATPHSEENATRSAIAVGNAVINRVS